MGDYMDLINIRKSQSEHLKALAKRSSSVESYGNTVMFNWKSAAKDKKVVFGRAIRVIRRLALVQYKFDA